MGSKVMRANYPDLDVAKLLMAFLVVKIHTRPLVGFPCRENHRGD